MNKLFIRVAEICLAVFAGLFLTCSAQAQTFTNSRLATPVYILQQPPTKDIGTIYRGDLVVYSYDFKDALIQLVQGARQMKANGIITPRKTAVDENGVIKVIADIAFIRDPRLLNGTADFVLVP